MPRAKHERDAWEWECGTHPLIPNSSRRTTKMKRNETKRNESTATERTPSRRAPDAPRPASAMPAADAKPRLHLHLPRPSSSSSSPSSPSSSSTPTPPPSSSSVAFAVPLSPTRPRRTSACAARVPLRGLPPPPAQQDARPAPPPRLGHPRLAPQGGRLRPGLRRAPPRRRRGSSSPTPPARSASARASARRSRRSASSASATRRHRPRPAPPLVIRGDFHAQPFANDTFDFEFSNVFDHALYPGRFVAEIERTLRPGGVAVLHVAVHRRGDKYSANDLLDVHGLVGLFRRSDVVRISKVDAFGLDTEVILRKKRSSP